MLLDFIIFIIAAAVLARSSIFLIDTVTRIALKLRVSEYLVGFVIMAVATSLPELFVGIVAAVEERPTFSLGNVVGANIANLTLILGLAALVTQGLRVQVRVRNKEIFYTALCAVAPLVMLLDGKLSQSEGATLLFFFAFYIYNLLFYSREYTKVVKDHRPPRPLVLEFGLFGLGLLVLLGSAEVLIRSGEAVALAFGIPSILIGITFIALGTTLPELSVAIPAALKRQGAMIMGNALGSVVTNATLVLGTVAIIQPIVLERSDIFATSAGVLILTLLICTGFIRSEYMISRKEALALILGYLLFVIAELFFGMRG